MRLAHLPCFINSFVVVGVCLSLHVSRPSLYHLSFLAISYAILSYAIPALSYAPPFSLTPSLPSQIRPSRLSLAPFSYAHPSSHAFPALSYASPFSLTPFSYAPPLQSYAFSAFSYVPPFSLSPSLTPLPCSLARPFKSYAPPFSLMPFSPSLSHLPCPRVSYTTRFLSYAPL